MYLHPPTGNLICGKRQVDLVISVGGDGTVLSASHFLGDNIPLVGVNSDPNRAEEIMNTTKKTDERRSFGALCMCTALDVEEMLPKVWYGRVRCRFWGGIAACDTAVAYESKYALLFRRVSS